MTLKCECWLQSCLAFNHLKVGLRGILASLAWLSSTRTKMVKRCVPVTNFARQMGGAANTNEIATRRGKPYILNNRISKALVGAQTVVSGYFREEPTDSCISLKVKAPRLKFLNSGILVTKSILATLSTQITQKHEQILLAKLRISQARKGQVMLEEVIRKMG